MWNACDLEVIKSHPFEMPVTAVQLVTLLNLLPRCTVHIFSPPQRPPTVTLGRNERRLGRGKNKSVRGTPIFSLHCSPSHIFLSLVVTNRSLCGGERYISVTVTVPGPD